MTFQTAIAWRYGQLVRQTERYSTVMDAAFNFSPLLLTQGDALIMPPLIARSGASMRIEDSMTATAATSTYELLEPARYIAAAPHWREFLMMDDFPAPESPHPAVLPRNSEERAIWRSAVREAWAQGLAEADLLYADNVARMTRSYRGAMLYHLLTAQHLLSRIRTASSETGIRTSGKGNLLHIGQRIYRITAPSAFTVSLPTSQKKGAAMTSDYYPYEPRIRWDHGEFNNLLLWATQRGMSDLCLRSGFRRDAPERNMRPVTKKAISTDELLAALGAADAQQFRLPP